MIYCIVMVCLLIIVSVIIDLCRAVLFSKLKKQITLIGNHMDYYIKNFQRKLNIGVD